MVWAIGLRKTFKVLGKHPALLLTTVFSNFTFGLNQIKYCSREGEARYLRLSWPLTWVNFVISSIGICSLWIHRVVKIGLFTPEFPDFDTRFAIPLLLFNFFTLMLLQFLPKCKPSCCQCCQHN